MEFKRRSTFRDKVIAVLATFLSILLWINAFEMWKTYGKAEWLDLIVGLIAFGIATLFTNIKRFTYIHFEKDGFIWYRAIFFKKKISGKDIKAIKAKMNHVILINNEGQELWIPMAFIRAEDASEITERLKKL